MKFRTFITPLAAVGGLVFIVGLVLLGSLLLRNPLVLIDQGGQQLPTTFQFVPKQSTIAASLLTRPDRLTDLWEYLTSPSLRKQTKQDMKQIEQFLLAGTGLNYEKDIQPWLGEEITTAIVSPDLDQNPQNGMSPGYLVALTCQDSQAARAMVELFWQNRAIAGDALVFEDFSGNRMIYSRRGGGIEPNTATGASEQSDLSRLATALVANQFVLVANHPEVLRQALNAAQSKDNNLAADQRYRSALKALPRKRIGLLALSLPATARSLGVLSPEDTHSVDLINLGKSGNATDWGLVSLGLTREGILGDIALLAVPGQSLEPSQTFINTLPQAAYFLPEEAAITTVGLSLKSLWSTIQPLWQQYGQDRNFQSFLGEDLSLVLNQEVTRELFNAVANNSALGLNLGPSEPDWLLVTEQTSNLSQALQHLQTIAQTEGIGVNTLMVQGQPTTTLTRLMLKPHVNSSPSEKPEVIAQVVGLHTQIEHMSIMASSPALMDAALRKSKTEKVLPDWTTNLSLFQQPNEGYIHINWPRLQSGLRPRISSLRLWETTAKPVLRHLKQITLTSYGRTHELQAGRVFFQLSNQ